MFKTLFPPKFPRGMRSLLALMVGISAFAVLLGVIEQMDAVYVQHVGGYTALIAMILVIIVLTVIVWKEQAAGPTSGITWRKMQDRQYLGEQQPPSNGTGQTKRLGVAFYDIMKLAMSGLLLIWATLVNSGARKKPLQGTTA